MIYTDYEKLINDGLNNPDKAPVLFKDVLENLKADLTSLETLTSKTADQETRIRDLQDTNMKLFLSQTTNVNTAVEEEQELEGDAALAEFIKHLKGDK